jgi:superfamily II DNA or RNA helicase
MDDARRMRPGETVRIRGERWIVQRQSGLGEVSTLDVRGADATNRGERARFLLPFEPIEPVALPREPKVVRVAEWRVVTRQILAAATPSPDCLRAAARGRFDVLPYQLEPALAVTGGHGCRLLIADEVGLGKTVQAGLIVAEILERNPNGRALVICPAGLRLQWQHELRHRFSLPAGVLDAEGLSRVASGYDASANPWAAMPLAIASVDFIKRPEVMRGLEGLVWDLVVFDEAHNLATRSDRGTAAAAIAGRARLVVMLSATPHSGDEAAFDRLCSLGDLRGRFPLLLFRRTRRDAGVSARRRTAWLRIRPTAAERQMHSALRAYALRVWQERPAGDGGRLAITVLLRRASSGAGALARSLERRLAALAGSETSWASQIALPFEIDTDDEPGAAVLAPGLADQADECRCLEPFLNLARVAARCESKIAALLRYLSRVREPVLVFTEYRDTLAILRRGLAGDVQVPGIVELHGGLTRSQRESAEREFVSGNAAVLLATDAASEGLNLHHRCRCVVNLEIPWNPVRLEQRVGRVDRIGQARRVHAIHFVAGDTYETDTVRRIVERSARAAGALHDDSPSAEATSNAILTGIDVPERQTRALPAAIRRPDLTSRADVEARRITAWRRLGLSLPCEQSRAVATVLPGRASRLLCGFRITVADPDGFPIWTTTLGIEATLAARPRSRAELRAILDTQLAGFEAAATVAGHQVETAIAAIIAAGAGAELDRENAIVAAIRLRHARIAADLLQPGLFDRRIERRATTQAAVLEEALGRCHLRLESLARLADAHVEPPAVQFAVVPG